MTTEIKPCPFCGGSDVSISEGETFRWMFAECDACGARASDVRVKTMGEGTKEEYKAEAEARAIQEWNTRAEVAPTSPASGALPADKIKAARDILHRLCQEGHLRMSVPVREDSDEDFILSDVINAAALASREASPAPLTDEQIIQAALSVIAREDLPPKPAWNRHIAFARAVLALASPQVASQPQPAAWQERQQTRTGWTDWYDVGMRKAIGKNGHALSEVVSGIEYQWRPLYAAPAPVAPTPEPVVEKFVPVSAKLRDGNGNHPNDNEQRTEACCEALRLRGDDEGQGLDSFWKWGFAAGFNAALAKVAPTPSNDWNDAIEAAARRIENGSFLHDQAPAKLFANEVAPVIRSMKRAPSAEVTPTPAQPSEDARDATRYRKMRAWFVREPRLADIAPHGHMQITTNAIVDAGVDALPSEPEGETP
jgi:Lar family restriction alleviation protein